MMKRNLLTVLCCAVLAIILQGCQLARDDAGSQAYEDRMIGVFITTEHLDLFDMESYLNDNLNRFSGGEIKMSGDTEKYQGRIYATLISKTLTNEETGEPIESQDFMFGIEGFPYFAATMPANSISTDSYISSTSDEAITDGHMGITEKDEGTTTTLEGTIYVALSYQNRAFYFNPVYQSADGSVYLTAGTGLSSSTMDYEGSTMSQSMDSTTTITENGEATTNSLSIKVSISTMSVPEKTVIVQMDANHMPLSRTQYATGEMPEAFSPVVNTEYIILETHKRNAAGEQVIGRDIYGRDAETIEYFIAREDGICVKRTARLDW